MWSNVCIKFTMQLGYEKLQRIISVLRSDGRNEQDKQIVKITKQHYCLEPIQRIRQTFWFPKIRI